jgi:GAF domain-containing protein
MGISPEAGSGHSPALADEQAALRRVAILVARAAPPAEVFAAVAEEVGRVLQADGAFIARYQPGCTRMVVAAWSASGETLPVGSHGPIVEGSVTALVQATGRPARMDRYPPDVLAWVDTAARGFRCTVAVPITVEGRLWGAMVVASTNEPPPPGTEERLTGFAELVAAAIANAQARVELRGYAEEQAALRRVATLVARGAPPEEVFAAVTEEVGGVMDADLVSMDRYDPSGTVTVLAARPATLATGWSIGGRNVSTLVFETGRSARIDDYAEASGPGAVPTREWGSARRWARRSRLRAGCGE